MEVLFGILILKASRRNWRRYRIVSLDLQLGIMLSSGILEQLKWESLKKRWTDIAIQLFYPFRIKFMKISAHAHMNEYVEANLVPHQL